MTTDQTYQTSRVLDASIYWLTLNMRDLALDAAREMTTTYPENANGWFRQGVIELLCDRKSDAMASLTQAVRHDHDQIEAWALLCTLWAQFSLPEAAQVTARRVLTERPDLAPVIAQAALELQRNQAALEALDVIDAVTKTGYITVELARAHAQLLGEMGFPDEAAKALRAIWGASEPQAR